MLSYCNNTNYSTSLYEKSDTNNDGDDKQNCEVNASKRWLDRLTNPTDKKTYFFR